MTADVVDIKEQGDTGIRKLPIFEQIYSLSEKNPDDSLSSECSEREEDSLATNSTGSPNDSMMDLDKSSFDDIVDNLYKDYVSEKPNWPSRLNSAPNSQ